MGSSSVPDYEMFRGHYNEDIDGVRCNELVQSDQYMGPLDRGIDGVSSGKGGGIVNGKDEAGNDEVCSYQELDDSNSSTSADIQYKNFGEADSDTSISSFVSFDVEDDSKPEDYPSNAAEIIRLDTPADYIPFTRQSWFFKSKQLASLSLPIMGSYIMNSVVNVSLLAFVGHLGEDYSAAIGLAITFISVTGYAFSLGMLSALDTLCPQAFGPKNYRRVSIVLYRGILLTWIFSIPILILWMFTRQVLLLFGQNESVSSIAAYFVMIQIPALPFFILSDALRKYMQAQGIVLPGSVILFIVDSISIALGYFVILHSSIGWYGFPYTILFNNITQAIALILYIYVSKLYVLTYAPFNLFQVFEFAAFMEFMSLGLSGVAMLSTEWIGFEIHTIMAGLISIDVLTSHVILLNINNVLYVISLGMSVAVNTLIGNEFGSGKYQEAKLSCKVGFLNVQVLMIFVSIILAVFRGFFIGLFTTSQQIIQIAKECILILPLFLCADSAQVVLGGVIKGAGLQKKGGIINVVSYYLVGVPLGIVLAFKWGMDLKLRGLWLGIATASWMAALLNFILLLRSNWSELSRRAIIRSVDKDKIPLDILNPSLSSAGSGTRFPWFSCTIPFIHRSTRTV